MRIDAEALREHADRVCEESLLRRSARLRRLTADERRMVESTARAVGRGVAGCMLERAATDATLAAVLETLYPSVRNGAPLDFSS
jgi:hypothetical protein